MKLCVSFYMTCHTNFFSPVEIQYTNFVVIFWGHRLDTHRYARAKGVAHSTDDSTPILQTILLPFFGSFFHSILLVILPGDSTGMLKPAMHCMLRHAVVGLNMPEVEQPQISNIT